MGKRIIQQARGKGSLTYRVRKKAFTRKISYPMASGEAKIIQLEHSPAHSAPLARVQIGKDVFFTPAFSGAYVEQKISIGNQDTNEGNILHLKDIPQGTSIFNIERNPGDGGKMIRTAGSSAMLTKKLDSGIVVTMPNRKELILHPECRATIGIVAGDGRILKPFMTAGRKYHKMKARNKLWPRTSAVKVNVVDHPFGSGRGKRPKPKIAQRNASPGQKVGHLRPRRTGWQK